MSLKHWLETLRVPFRRTRNGRIPRQRSRYSPTAVSASERLEERALLTANLFVDFGDNFPGGTLVTTEGAFRDIAVAGGPDNAILGPELTDDGGFNAGTALHIVAQPFTPAVRAQMLATVIRAYQPLDINVVELTTTPFTTEDGRTVLGATSMADVITTLRGGVTAWKDAYIFVGTFIADPLGPNEKIYGPDGGGTSPVNGLDISDLNSGQNLHDDVAVVFADDIDGYNFNTMNNIAHEAGHNFGLQHSLTKSSDVAATDLLHRSELMSYLNTNFTTSSIAFSRYPVIRGDDNSPGGPLVSYDDLEARGVGNLTPFDQLATDPTIGPNPDYFFVSGTGAHDVITLTKNGLNADITVTAYADAARTTGIPVPGVTTPGNTYSYSIPLTRPILVYAGFSDDRIEIYGDLGVTVTVDGMLGTDSLFVSTGSSIGAVWTPRTTAPAGVDLNGSIFVPDYGGAVTFGTTTIQLNNFETTSSLEFTGVTNVSVEGSTGNDTLQLRRSTLGGIQQVTGTLGVVSMIPVTLTGASSVQIDGLAGSDQLTVDNTNGIITIPITWNGGSGGVLESDTLRVLGGSFTTIRSTFTNVNDGTLNLDTNTISYTGLEPVLLNVGSVTNIIFDLPAIANPDVIIRDDGFAPDPNGNTANTSSIDGSTFEFTEFTNPTTSLQVNGALAFSNTVTLAVLDSLWGSASVELNGGNIADTFNIQATPSGTTTVNAGTGIDQFVISGDGLSGTSLFRGDADNDEFLLNIISHIGATAVSGPTVSVQIEGNANPLANSANRDRLTINDSNEEFVRNLIYDFLDTQGDLDILAGALNAGLFGPEGAGSLALNVRTMETLRFNSSGTADDIVAITGRSVDDDLTVALTPTVAGQTVAGTSAFVFLNGTPYTGSPGATSPPDTLSANFPGIAGGGNGTDLLLNGIAAATGLTVDGSGSSLTGNRVIVQAISETNLTDAIALAAALDVFNLGLGAGVLVPGAGGGNGFDAIAINGSTTLDVDMGTVTSAINQVLARNILSGPLVPVTVVPASLLNGTTPGARSGLIVNGGDEILARASGIADNFTASPHPLFNIGVNGNLPVSGAISADGFLAGDQLILISPAAFSLWSDKLPLPNVSIFAGNNPHGIVSTSMERTRLFPGNGTVNLIGDQNNPLIDQTDRFRVIGLDVDTNGSLDAGVQEMMVTVNQSAPILIDGVQKLNVYGYDLTGQDLNNPNPNAADISVGLPAVNIDTLEITPFADNAGGPGLNAPRGWGVQTVFNEGSPNGVDGDAADLLVVHTSIGVNHGMDIFGGGIISDQVAVRPSGPDNGEVRMTNAVDGSMVATISFVNNTDLILVDDDESLSDSDSLILYGTDSGAQVSGNDSFDVDFEAAGTLESPMVTVRDSDTAQILYRLRGFTSPTFGTGTFTSVSFDMLGGNDSMRIKSGLLAVQPNNGFAVGMSQLTIQGGVGDDSLTLNYTTSEDWRGGRVTYDGGAGADVLSFVDDTGQQIVGFGPQIPFTTVTYTPGPTAGSGRIEHLMQGSNESAILDFRQLEPVFDFTTAATLIINANNADNAISYYTDFGVGTLSAITAGGAFTTDGVYLNVPLTGGTGSGARADFTVVGGTVTLVTLVNDGIGYSLGDSLSVNPVSLGGGAGGFTIPVASFSGTVAVDNQEVLVFSNKTNLQINGLGGSDFISLNNPITPNGLTGIAVNGGDPTGSDTLLVNGIAGAFDNFQIAPISIGSGLVNSTTSAVVPVTFSATEHLQIVGQSPDGD
ncbi:MAG: reprolysin-like metallopeptidase, partial [Planctomycetia bacterium]